MPKLLAFCSLAKPGGPMFSTDIAAVIAGNGTSMRQTMSSLWRSLHGSFHFDGVLYGLVGFHADSMEHHNRTNSYTVNYLNANMNINRSIRVYNIANSYCKFLGMFRHNMGMDQYLYIPFLGDEHPFTSYFDVHQGDRVLTHPHMKVLQNWPAFGFHQDESTERLHQELSGSSRLETRLVPIRLIAPNMGTPKKAHRLNHAQWVFSYYI